MKILKMFRRKRVWSASVGGEQSHVSSVCLLGGHEVRQRNRVVSRGSQEETDGCCWGHVEFEETEKPLKGCVDV